MPTTSSLNLELKASLELQDRLRVLARQVQAIQASRREELGRELSTLLAQQLVPVNSQLEALKKLAGTNLRVLNRRISKLHRIIDRAAATMQHFAWNLHPSVLDDLGLIPALAALRKAQANERGNHFELTIAPNLAIADEPMRNAFYCIARETMTGADLTPPAQIFLTDVPGGLSMVVTYTQSDLQEIRNSNFEFPICSRLSIHGMSERINMVGGKFWSSERSGEPMELRIEIPFRVIIPSAK